MSRSWRHHQAQTEQIALDLWIKRDLKAAYDAVTLEALPADWEALLPPARWKTAPEKQHPPG